MKIRWRKGLRGTDSRTRPALLAVEALARRTALESHVGELCAQQPFGIADCSDVSVFGSTLQWGRYRGLVLVRVAVYLTPGMLRFEYNWKLDRRSLHQLCSRGLDKPGLG